MDILILSQCRLKYLLSVVQKKCVCVCVCVCTRMCERERVGEANEAKQMSQTVNSQIQ